MMQAMNRTYFRMVSALAAAFLFVACTQDELTNSTDTLPEGMYPLEISSVTLNAEVSSQPWGADGPQTRVSENNPDRNSSKWDGNEVITVQLGDNQTTTYKVVNTDGTLEHTGDQLYWTKRTDKVTAWYPANGTFSLSDQSKKLAYVLQATTKDAKYDEPVALDFKHQLAKIRVVLTGDKASEVDNVSIKSYTSYKNTNGEVKGDNTSTGEIIMYKVNDKIYEASVVPGKTIEEFKVNDGNWVNLSKTVTPVAGNYHEISITAKKPWPDRVSSGEYTISGESSKTVKLAGDATLILDGAISQGAKTAIRVIEGNPTIIVKGTSNSFNCYDTPILLDPGANVTIKGATNDPKESKLTIRTSADAVAGIGSATQSSCDNISIANVTLDVHGGTGKYGGAAIGTNGDYSSSCGDITIENSMVYAKGGTGASAIGLSTGSLSKKCGEIKIIHSKIFATTTYDDYFESYAACIGHGAQAKEVPASVGKITITTKETQKEFFSTDRFKALDVNGNEVTTGFYKVGKCTNSKYQPLVGALSLCFADLPLVILNLDIEDLHQ